ncbi:MAG: HDOD domain-containing protein, partial [Oscillospiraceae bacterium]
NVNTQDDYDLAEKMGCKQMQGNFLADLKTQKIHRVDHLQGNFFQLIVAVSKDDPDIDEIATIISRDVTLAFSLIKLVNSAYFALRNRAKSVKQALIVLGLGQLKQWVYLLSFKQDNSDTPDELIRISFLRANFAQEMVPYISNIPISKSEAYLMGMFSTLGVLMQVSLESALAELSVADEIKDALVKHEGLCGQLYDMILCYEKADWTGITKYAKELNIPVNIISQKYFECVEYVNKIWQTLTHPYDDAAD